jgi:hypothetical protein
MVFAQASNLVIEKSGRGMKVSESESHMRLNEGPESEEIQVETRVEGPSVLSKDSFASGAFGPICEGQGTPRLVSHFMEICESS